MSLSSALSATHPSPLAWTQPAMEVLSRHGVEVLLVRDTGSETHPSAHFFFQKHGKQAFVDMDPDCVLDARKAVDGTATYDLADRIFHPCLDELLALTRQNQRLQEMMKEANLPRQAAQQALDARYPWTPFVLRALFGGNKNEFVFCGFDLVKHKGQPALAITLDHTPNCAFYLKSDLSLAEDPKPIQIVVSPEDKGNAAPQESHWIYKKFAPKLAACRETLALAQEDNIVWRAPWALDMIHHLVRREFDILSLSLNAQSPATVSIIISGNYGGFGSSPAAYTAGIKIQKYGKATLFSPAKKKGCRDPFPSAFYHLMDVEYSQRQARTPERLTYLQSFERTQNIYPVMPSMHHACL